MDRSLEQRMMTNIDGTDVLNVAIDDTVEIYSEARKQRGQSAVVLPDERVRPRRIRLETTLQPLHISQNIISYLCHMARPVVVADLKIIATPVATLYALLFIPVYDFRAASQPLNQRDRELLALARLVSD